jgi:hypothetical protein
MRLRCIAPLWVAIATAVAVLPVGCAAPGRARLAVCPGKANAGEALAALAAHAGRAAPFRANGQILVTYHAPDSGKEKRHNLPMTLWFDPPWQTYIQGSIAVDPKAVIIGSNRQSFWLALRPQEVSSLYIGDWDQAQDVEGLMMSPKVILEAFGIVTANEPNEGRWSLQNEGAFDVLTERSEAGRLVKRIHIYACDYTVRKIEYFDEREKVMAVAELADYKPLTEDFRVPTRVKATAVGPDKRRDSIDISISSTKAMEFSPRQRAVIFSPPKSEDFEHLYTLEDGRWVPQRP